MHWLFSLLMFLLPITALAENHYESHGQWQLLSLKAESRHVGSKVWQGKFTGLNGQLYDVSGFYQTNQPTFSARAIFTKTGRKQMNWLLPIALDGGYDAKLYQAEPLLSLGFGAAMAVAPQTMLSLRLDNALRLGGDISEQPCYDGFRRQYHCGTGLAWGDYRQIDSDRRDNFALPRLTFKYVTRFSF
jgi:hypothetical protein